MEDTSQAPGTEKSTETEILCSQPVPITPCCQSLCTGGQSRGGHSWSEKGQLAPAADPQLEVFGTGSEKCTFEFKNAFSNSIYHHHHHLSIKIVVLFFFFSFNVLYRFPLCTDEQYPQNLGIKHWCSAAANVHVHGLAPRTQVGILFLTDMQPPVPMFVFSPVIPQNSRNNQNFKPRALQDIAQHHENQDIQEEVGKLVCAPKKLLSKSQSLHLHRSPGEMTRSVSVMIPHQTDVQILGLERGWKTDWLKGNGLKSTFWDI